MLGSCLLYLLASCQIETSHTTPYGSWEIYKKGSQGEDSRLHLGVKIHLNQEGDFKLEGGPVLYTGTFTKAEERICLYWGTEDSSIYLYSFEGEDLKIQSSQGEWEYLAKKLQH